MGQFKEKRRGCFSCGARWETHEEKETDVNIALHMLDDAYNDKFDRALLISADSDLTPPIRMVLDRFPDKQVRVITPIGRNHSLGLVNAAGGTKNAKRMTRAHVEMALFPANVVDVDGNTIATRPNAYTPPQ